MSKKTVINEIMDVYEENERLKNNIDKLIAKYEGETNKVEIKVEINETNEDKLDKIAKAKLFESVFNHYYTGSIEVRENDGEFNFLTYEQWEKTLKRNAFQSYDEDKNIILEDMPLQQIKNYFRENLVNYYTKTVNDKKMELVRAAKENKDE